MQLVGEVFPQEKPLVACSFNSAIALPVLCDSVYLPYISTLDSSAVGREGGGGSREGIQHIWKQAESKDSAGRLVLQ